MQNETPQETLARLRERYANPEEAHLFCDSSLLAEYYAGESAFRLAEHYAAEAARMAAENERLRKALVFYANHSNYGAPLMLKNGKPKFVYRESDVMKDFGELARQALRATDSDGGGDA